MKKITLVVISIALLAIIAAPAQSFGAPLDRAALIKLANSYFAALVAHNPKGVPLADNVKMVEQIRRINPGEGVWKTATSGPTEFKIVVPDPVSQQVAGIVVMGIGGKPAMFGFRLKVENDRITEAEHMIVDISNPDNPNIKTVRPAIPLEIPYEYRDSRGRLIWIAKSYYDALEWNNGSLSPFASDCERRENGARSAPNGGPSLSGNIPGNAAKPRPASLLGMQDCAAQLSNGVFQYIDTITPRRVEVADEVTGLVVGFSQLRHSMEKKIYRLVNTPGIEERDMTSQRPFDMPSLHIYKIWGGQIHEIEALGLVEDYNAPTGWE